MLLCEAVPNGRQPHSCYMSYLKQTLFSLTCLPTVIAEGNYFLFNRIGGVWFVSIIFAI